MKDPKFSKLVPGDLLWNKCGKFPFWPCMVSNDPKTGKCFKIIKSEQKQYHVQYFGQKVERGYAKLGKNTLLYEGIEKFHAKMGGKKLTTKLGSYDKFWESAVKEAEEAFSVTSVSERVKTYEFIYPYITANKKTQTHVKEKQSAVGKEGSRRSTTLEKSSLTKYLHVSLKRLTEEEIQKHTRIVSTTTDKFIICQKELKIILERLPDDLVKNIGQPFSQLVKGKILTPERADMKRNDSFTSIKSSTEFSSNKDDVKMMSVVNSDASYFTASENFSPSPPRLYDSSLNEIELDFSFSEYMTRKRRRRRRLSTPGLSGSEFLRECQKVPSCLKSTFKRRAQLLKEIDANKQSLPQSTSPTTPPGMTEGYRAFLSNLNRKF